jgi:hypothetical protein
MNSSVQRQQWRQLARFVSQLGLAPGEELPVEQVEELANAVLLLLDEEQQVDEARAWARWAYSAAGEVGGFRMPAAEVPAWLSQDEPVNDQPLAEANRVLRGQLRQLAVRVSGLTGEPWEEVLASVGVERQSSRDPGPTGPVRDS